MNPMQRIGLVDRGLFAEVARSTLTIDTVYALYGVAILAASALWLIGVVAFGGRPSSNRAAARTALPSSDRITPAVP